MVGRVIFVYGSSWELLILSVWKKEFHVRHISTNERAHLGIGQSGGAKIGWPLNFRCKKILTLEINTKRQLDENYLKKDVSSKAV